MNAAQPDPVSAANGPSVSAIINALTATRDETVACLRQPATVQERTYRPGSWTMRQVLLHVVDCEGVMLDRLRRLAADDKPLLWAYDENRWTTTLAPSGRSLETAIALFTASRATIIEMASLIPANLHVRSGIHSEAGRRTWIEQLAMVHQHNAHHLGQVRACIAGTQWRAGA